MTKQKMIDYIREAFIAAGLRYDPKASEIVSVLKSSVVLTEEQGKVSAMGCMHFVDCRQMFVSEKDTPLRMAKSVRAEIDRQLAEIEAGKEKPIEQMTKDEIRAELKANGIDTTKAFGRVQEALQAKKERKE